jgi:hypothetical protein
MKLHITEKALNEVIVPEEKKYILAFDTEQTGFAAQKTKAGTMSYMDNGNPRQANVLRKVRSNEFRSSFGISLTRLFVTAAPQYIVVGYSPDA